MTNPDSFAAPTCLLQHHHLTDLPPFASVFDPQRPVEVDIGCGKGRFLLARAAANPGIQFLGIERLLLRTRKIDKKVQRLGLQNVRLMRLEANYTLQYYLPEHSISRFFLLFPDPWPKQRHHKRRLFDEAFRSLIWSRLITGGEIQVATDHLDYFAAIKRLLDDDPRFEAVPPYQRPAEEQTDFELIFRGQNLPIGACGYRALPAGEIQLG